MQKKDNQLIQYFIQNLQNHKNQDVQVNLEASLSDKETSTLIVLQEQNQCLSLDQLTELKSLSLILY